MTAAFLTLDSNIDIKNICKFSFDFNLLKEIIEVLISSQKTLSKRVNFLEKNAKEKEIQILEYLYECKI